MPVLHFTHGHFPLLARKWIVNGRAGRWLLLNFLLDLALDFHHQLDELMVIDDIAAFDTQLPRSLAEKLVLRKH